MRLPITSFLLLLGFHRYQGKPVLTCQSAECNNTARRILEYINTDVNPCENFYEFACGNYLSHLKAPQNYSTDVINLMHLTLQEKLIRIFTESRITEPKLFKLVKQFYADCLTASNGTQMNTWKLQFLNKIRELGGWPAARTNWDENNFSIINFTAKTVNMGFDPDYLWDIYVFRNEFNKTYYSLYILPPTAPCLLYKNKVVQNKNYFKLKILVAKKLSTCPNISELMDSFSLEFNIGRMSCQYLNSNQDQELKSVQLTIGEMQRRFPYINWVEYMIAYTNLNSSLITKSTNMVVIAPLYLTRLGLLLKKTKKRTIANYLIWKIIYRVLYMDAKSSKEPRWKHCIKKTLNSWKWLTAALYVKYNFNVTIKKYVYEMAEAIKTEIQNSISNSTWLDKQTRQNALEKLNSLTLHVAYPDIVTNTNQLEKLYENLQIKPNDYYQSCLKLQKFNRNLIVKRLLKPYMRKEWPVELNLLQINAQYAPTLNAMFIPVGILSKNAYIPDVPNYMNFGTIGWVIGHEISHAFDSQGCFRDKDGFLNDWWTNETMKKFTHKIQCFIDHFNKYEDYEVGLQINGTRTVSENTADYEGIKNAYKAYVNWVKKRGPELKLPGLKYTPRQLFWISGAQFWCSKTTSRLLKFQLKYNVHVPCKFRVIGGFSNQQSFADDFQCPVNTPMNPEKKCTLW